MIRTILIDDEPLARSVLRNYLKEYDQIEVAGEAANGFEGIKSIQQHQPELIFLDIQMPKLSGLEMLELLETPPRVIFCTAFDQYALKAFEAHALDYLLKPVSRSRFREAVERALEAIAAGDQQSHIARFIDEQHHQEEIIDRLAVRQGSKIVIIPVSEIDHIQAEDDYVAIHTGGKKYLKQLKMKYLEKVLPPADFLRVHRSHIIAMHAIERLEAYSKDSYIAILKTKEKIPVSRNGYQNLREILGF